MEEPRVLHEGSKCFWKSRCTLDVIIVTYPERKIVEIVAYEPTFDAEAPRIYLDDKVLVTKVDPVTVDKSLRFEKEKALRRHEVPNMALIVQNAEDKAKIEYILNRLFIKYLSFEERKIVVELQFNFRDRDEETGGPDISTMIISKPDDLTAFRSAHCHSLMQGAVSMAIHALHEEQLEAEQLREEAEGLEKRTTSLLDFRERWRVPIVINKVINKRPLSTSDAHIWNVVSQRFEAKTAAAAFKMMTTAMATPMAAHSEDGSSSWGLLGKGHGTKGGRAGQNKPGGLGKQQNSAPRRSLMPAAMFSGQGNAAIVKNSSGKSSSTAHAPHARSNTAGGAPSLSSSSHHTPGTVPDAAAPESGLSSTFSAISTSVKKRLGLTKAATSPNLSEPNQHGRGNGQGAHLDRSHTSGTGAAEQAVHGARSHLAGQSPHASVHKDQAGSSNQHGGVDSNTSPGRDSNASPGRTLGMKGFVSPRPSQRHSDRPPTIEEGDANESSVYNSVHGAKGDQHGAESRSTSGDHRDQHLVATAHPGGAHPGVVSHGSSGSPPHPRHTPQHPAAHPAPHTPAAHDAHGSHAAQSRTGNHGGGSAAGGEHHAGPHSTNSHTSQSHPGHNGDHSAQNSKHGHDSNPGSHHSPDGKALPHGQSHSKNPTKESYQKPVKRRSLLMRLSISLGIVDESQQNSDGNAPVAHLLRDLVSSHALLDENTSPDLSRANSDSLANSRPYPGFLHDAHAQEKDEDGGNTQKHCLKPVKTESKTNFFARSFQAISGRTNSTAASSAVNNHVSHDSQQALSLNSHSPLSLGKERSMTSPETPLRARQHVDGHDAFHGRTDALPNKSPAMFPEDAAAGKAPPRHAHPHEAVTAQTKGNAMGKIWHSLMGNNKVGPGE